ncbi:MAG: hypothetical protein HY043_09200 [Verrucomicrobia bacterium]|nr:hypothetical protein [Verrucomicrobiota bacterium]
MLPTANCKRMARDEGLPKIGAGTAQGRQFLPRADIPKLDGLPPARSGNQPSSTRAERDDLTTFHRGTVCSPVKSWKSNFDLLLFNDFHDALGIDHGPFRLSEEKNHVVIFWRAKTSRLIEVILHAIVEPHREWAEWLPFHSISDVFDFHCGEFTSTAWCRQLKSKGPVTLPACSLFAAPARNVRKAFSGVAKTGYSWLLAFRFLLRLGGGDFLPRWRAPEASSPINPPRWEWRCIVTTR